MGTRQKIEFLLKKILQILLSMLVLSLLVFFIARLSPGDPLKSYYGESVERMSQEQKGNARKRLGLDEPLMVQYVRWAENALHGDFGISYKYKQDVGAVIEKVYANTLILGGVSYVLTFLLAILLGIFCAMREGHLADRIICKVGTITNCIPSFFLALVLILIFGVNLAVLPTSGAYSLGGGDRIGDRIVHLILPVSVMVLSHLWYYTYMVRNKLLEEIREDYVLLCKVKGMGKRRIMFTHCLRKIMPSLISIMAISVPHIIGGTYVAESVFSYPGLGTLSMESAQYHDYNMLMILSLITGFAVIVANVLGQILSEWIDPRMRRERGEGML